MLCWEPYSPVGRKGTLKKVHGKAKVKDSLEYRRKIPCLNHAYWSVTESRNTAAKITPNIKSKYQDESSVNKCQREWIIKLNKYIYILMSAKCFFQETLGTNKKECLQASVALDISKGEVY